MSSQYNDFFDIPSNNAPTAAPLNNTEQSFFDIPSNKDTWVKPPSPTIKEQLKIAPELAAREAGATLWSLPSSTAEMWRWAGGKLAELGEKQAAQSGREITEEEKNITSNIVNYIPDVIKALGERFPNVFPSYKEAQEKINAQYTKETGKELPEKGRGIVERGAIGFGKTLPILAGPGSAALKAAAIGTSTLTEASDLSEKSKAIGNFTIPVLTSVIESIASKRYIPPVGEGKMLYEKGRELGMSANDLAPILATPGQIARHGKIAAGVSGTRKAFEHTGEVLGNAIEEMQNRPQNFKKLPTHVENELLTKFSALEQGIRKKTHKLSPKEENLADFIKDSIIDIKNNGSTPRQLIGTWRSVNGIDAGKSELRQMLGPIHTAIQKVDPYLAQDLIATNRMYSRYLGNLKEINPSQFNAFVDAGELQQLLGAVFSGNPQTLTQSILNYATLGSLRKISSSILTNAQAQSLVRNFGQAVRSGNKATAHALGIQLRNYVIKNLPEESKEIEWDKLGISD